MRWMKLLFVLTSGALVVGCAPKKKDPLESAPVPTTDRVAALRATYIAVSPKAKVGVVSAVLNDANYGTVSDIDTTDLKVGDILQILDAGENRLAVAKIAQVGDRSITITFDVQGARRPAVGDIAVRF